MSVHNPMVPFWRRRLLAATLPAALTCVWLWLLATMLIASSTSLFPLLASHWLIAGPTVARVGSLLAFCGLLTATLVPISKPTRHGRIGAGGVVALAFGGFFVLVWMQAGVLLGADAVAGITSDWSAAGHARILGLNVIGAAVFVLVFRSIRIRPRERAIQRLGCGACWAGLLMCAILLPIAGGTIDRFQPTPAGSGPHQQQVWHAVVASLHLASGGALLAFFGRQLADRHAGFHARHCWQCGYDLAGIEAGACPECMRPIGGDQSERSTSPA